MSPFPKLEEIRKNHIIEAAMLAIAEIGVANITMRDLARAACLSNGGLAHYYPSKEALFKDTFKEFYRRVFLRAKEEYAEIQDPMEKLLGYKAFFDVDDPAVPVGYPLIFDCMSLAVHDDAYKQIFSEWLENWIVLLRDAIVEGVEKNLFSDKIDPDSVARTISSIYLGTSIRWYLARDTNSTDWAMVAYKEAIVSLMAPYRNDETGGTK